MDISPVDNCNNGSNGIYEAWLVKGGKAPVEVDESGHVIGSKLLKAVDNAFRAYIDSVEVSMGAALASDVSTALAGSGSPGSSSPANAIASYSANANGQGFQVLTRAQMAPFLALSVMG